MNTSIHNQKLLCKDLKKVLINCLDYRIIIIYIKFVLPLFKYFKISFADLDHYNPYVIGLPDTHSDP